MVIYMPSKSNSSDIDNILPVRLKNELYSIVNTSTDGKSVLNKFMEHINELVSIEKGSKDQNGSLVGEFVSVIENFVDGFNSINKRCKLYGETKGREYLSLNSAVELKYIDDIVDKVNTLLKDGRNEDAEKIAKGFADLYRYTDGSIERIADSMGSNNDEKAFIRDWLYEYRRSVVLDSIDKGIKEQSMDTKNISELFDRYKGLFDSIDKYKDRIKNILKRIDAPDIRDIEDIFFNILKYLSESEDPNNAIKELDSLMSKELLNRLARLKDRIVKADDNFLEELSKYTFGTKIDMFKVPNAALVALRTTKDNDIAKRIIDRFMSYNKDNNAAAFNLLISEILSNKRYNPVKLANSVLEILEVIDLESVMNLLDNEDHQGNKGYRVLDDLNRIVREDSRLNTYNAPNIVIDDEDLHKYFLRLVVMRIQDNSDDLIESLNAFKELLRSENRKSKDLTRS
ncbi:MAG: hypothetical protein ARM1_0664 [Candidatus Micrarchaeota archaeon]|nr:MAG: hypothetical protein ARM1_0664 [Candidatus Micrarchaeota archaeon]